MDFDRRVDHAIQEMISIGYKPQAFITMRIAHKTVPAIKMLIHSKKVPEGFTKLWELKRLDLSMENIIQEKEWHDLFTEEDRKVAKKRLSDYGYNI
jgi:hypothetical protein